MILADTTIWIDYFRQSGLKPELRNLLTRRQVVMHPFVIAELALGSLRDRLQTLSDLENLPQLRVAELTEVRRMIEARLLYSKGIGLTDAHLIASCLLFPPTVLWTSDIRLGNVAASLGIGATIP
jgi:predicted nucleic acid-binding protein